MTISNLSVSMETTDVTSLSTDDVTYRCIVAKNVYSDRIEAQVFVDGEDGQLTNVDNAIVATAVGDGVDCPRVLAVGNLFVVHWIDYVASGGTFTSDLYRSIFDVTDLAGGWTSQGSVSIHTNNLYDHCAVTDSSPEEFIVTRTTAPGSIATTRYQTPFSWVDTVWSQTDAGLTIADTVLACHANETEGPVMVAYQDTLTLQAFCRDAGDGTNLQGPNEVFADLDSGDNHFTAVGITYVNLNEWCIVAEAADSADITAGGNRDYARMLAWRKMRRSSCTPLDESQWEYNVHMLSKPWTWVSGNLLQNEVFVGASYKSIADGQEFSQLLGYVLRLDFQALTNANAAGVVKPIMTSALTSGSVDARPHGASPVVTNISIGARMNHLSGVAGPPRYDLGPHHNTVMFSYIRFARLINARYGDQDSELEPGQACVAYLRHYHHDPTTIRSDAKQPAQPDTPQWRGNNVRALARPLEISGGLVWSGGLTWVFDGQQPVELGFPHGPEILTATAVGGGNNDDAADYYYYVNYVWTDAQGQTHRSPPSQPVQVTMAVGQGTDLEVRPCTLSMKDDTTRFPLASPINIEVWRTYTDGAGNSATEGIGSNEVFLFRRVFSGGAGTSFTLANTPVSDRSDFSQTISCGQSNALLQFNELAPFQLDLNTLQWVPPIHAPHTPLTVTASWRNRLWGVSPENGRVILYSEPILPLGTQYQWPRFPDTNAFRFDGTQDITALYPMDNVLLVFTRQSVHALSGNPATGGVGASLDLQSLHDGIGCIEPRSIERIPNGVTFQAEKGIHLVSRAFQIEYIGAAVHDLVRAAGNVRSAVHLVDRHEVRFTMMDTPETGPLDLQPRSLNYNYRNGRWSERVFPMFAQSVSSNRLNEMQHATAWRGIQGEFLHVVLAQGGLALERSDDDTVFADVSASATEAIPLDITTEWVHLTGIGGQMRVYEIGVQTRRHTTGELTIEAWFDVDGSYDSSGAADHTEVIESPAPDYVRFRPEVQKIRGVKLRIYESGTVPQTNSVEFVSMTIHYAAIQRTQGSTNN